MSKASTLRNASLAAPDVHDSISALSNVSDPCAAGERDRSVRIDRVLSGFQLSDGERADLTAFFERLAELEFITNRVFSDSRQDERLATLELRGRSDTLSPASKE